MAFGDVVQTVTRDAWVAGDKTVSFSAPTRGNLLVLRVAEAEPNPMSAAPTGWSTAFNDGDLVGGVDECALAIFYKIATGSETSATPTTGHLGAVLHFQEIDTAGLPVRLVTASGDAVGSTSISYTNCLAASYNNTVWPGIVLGAVAITHSGTTPASIAGSTFAGQAASASGSTVSSGTNNNFASVGIANWVLTSDVGAGTGSITWTNSNTARGAGAVFEAVEWPYFVAATAQVTGTGTTLTPDASALGLAAGDLLIVQVTNRNNNTPTAPAGQGWATITNISRAAGTAFNDSVFAKIWGLAGNTDDSTPTFTVASGTLGWGVTLSSYRNPYAADRPWLTTDDAIIASGTDNSTAAASTATAPSVSYAAGDNRTYVRTFATADDNALNAPSVGVLAYGGTSYDQTTGDNYSQASIYEENKDGATTTGTATVTESVNGNDVALTVTLVLAPTVLVTPRPPVVGASRAAQLASRW